MTHQDAGRDAILHARFHEVLKAHAALRDKSVTPFDVSVAETIFRASSLAMGDVAKGNLKRPVKVVSAPTGSGKSTFSVDFAAAAFLEDPNFSCGFVVETIAQADTVYRDLVALLPDAGRDLALWTSGHDRRETDKAFEEAHGFDRACVSHPDDLRAARIIVVCHARWKREMQDNERGSVSHYMGHPRSVLFIDEHPTLVHILAMTHVGIYECATDAQRADPDHPWVPLLNRIGDRMKEALFLPGASYAAVELVSPEEAEPFNAVTHVPSALLHGSEADRDAQRGRWNDVIRFIKAAADGCVFLARTSPRAFVAYELQFKAWAGCVLLDATADITGMTVLMKGMEEVEVPRVDFSRLEINHVPTPRAYQGKINELLEKAKTAQPYAEWMKEVVLSNTAPGDRVLIVTHKPLIDHQYIVSSAEDREPWQGRNVSLLNWGSGIGSNVHRDASHVFLFGEFYIPRRAIIGTALGLTETKATAGSLSGSSGGSLTGAYDALYEGHLLRHTKQLACRGRVRQISADGVCGPMKLFTSMKRDRLVRNLARLFPGAARPVYAEPEGQPKTAQDKLIELLMDESVEMLWSDEVEARTGIAARNLTAELKRSRVADYLTSFGWAVRSAKDLGQPGKRKALVREAALEDLAA